MSAIWIRNGRASDVDAIFAVHRDSVTSLCASHYTPAQIAHWLDGRTPEMYFPAIERRQLWVADDRAGALCGFVEIEWNEVTKLFVRGDRARKGVGRRLLAVAIEAIQTMGATSVYLDATANSRSFYARHGFVEMAAGERVMSATAPTLEVFEMELMLRPRRLG